MLKQGRLRGDRVRYDDGTIGRCVWYPISEELDDCGMCFDFSDEDANDLIELQRRLSETEPAECPKKEFPLSKPAEFNPLRWLRGRVNDLGWRLATL